MNDFRIYMCMTILSMGYKRLRIRLSFLFDLLYLYITFIVINGGGKD